MADRPSTCLHLPLPHSSASKCALHPLVTCGPGDWHYRSSVFWFLLRCVLPCCCAVAVLNDASTSSAAIMCRTSAGVAYLCRAGVWWLVVRLRLREKTNQWNSFHLCLPWVGSWRRQPCCCSAADDDHARPWPCLCSCSASWHHLCNPLEKL